ncbi:unannotated protein [freshwater metagenome]|uniref:Unannotated protein n=1 Tax=freshwater metagenome TaxID=449393 RepID=A0A6J5ZGG7_9ZZZZ
MARFQLEQLQLIWLSSSLKCFVNTVLSVSSLNSMVPVFRQFRWQIERQLEICRQSTDQLVQFFQLMMRRFVTCALLVAQKSKWPSLSNIQKRRECGSTQLLLLDTPNISSLIFQPLFHLLPAQSARKTVSRSQNQSRSLLRFFQATYPRRLESRLTQLLSVPKIQLLKMAM